MKEQWIYAVFALIFARLAVRNVVTMIQNTANNAQKFAGNALQNAGKWLPERNRNLTHVKSIRMNEHTTGLPLTNSAGGSANANGRQKRWILIGTAILIIAVAALWVGKQIQIRNLRNQSAQIQQQMERDSNQAIIQLNEQHLRLFAKPFVWAVRTEMMSNNVSQINLYTNEMIKEKNVSSIMVLNAAGKIISSTNKKWEGRDFSTVGNGRYMQSDTTIVDNINDSMLIMSSPVMGFNNRLGTLVVHYSLATSQLMKAGK